MPAPLPRRQALKLAAGAVALGSATALGRFAATGSDGVGGVAAVGLRSASQGAVTGPLRVGAWAAAPVEGRTGLPGHGFARATLRMVVRASVGGVRPRIRLSNRYGRAPLLVGSATLGVQLQDAATVPGSLARVLFGGRPQAVVPPGGELLSDPVALRRPVAARDALLVSLHLPGPTGPAAWHPRSQDATYLAAGDRTTDGRGRHFAHRVNGWYYLTGVDVLSSTATGTVVCFGDSITDGAAPVVGRVGGRWPDVLAARIAETRPDRPLGVVDLGIAGNKVLTDERNDAGPSGLGRFRADALTQPGLTDVFLLEGINDIGSRRGAGGAPLTAAELVAAYRTLIGQARAAGAAVHGCTLMPFQGAAYYSDFGDAVRQEVNRWIRTGGAFDSVVDLERTVRDPQYPGRYNAAYDLGDHLHPNDAGYTAMGAAVDLSALRG
ncbi:SGNH/GDSL hydrolase family protein [Streptacidiphilus sp. ASG 303]|uniref:SGNH/GDSL hydrolase family protein n=1 Tax=Streptacidiphilus sp. ASG 303 TaxID=2896847 RepID=UPI001E444824|nr:SGNH/GDSL hydrolase family protein [Streptacidiphilus sp. ASG 303]MCD0483162.1 SGNH/GDSL hydrolase family protein [Streptacidiphilus sp. ASG 303]